MTEFPRRAEAPGVHPDAPDVPAADVPVAGLMVATPMAGGGLCDMAYASGLDALRVACLARGIRLSTIFLRGESDVQQARNRCFAQFLASDHSHLLFIDADIGFSPDAALRLLAHNQPIVGATYAKKTAGPVQFAVSLLPVARRTDAGLIEVNGLAGGFLMIRRDAAERMAGAYRDLAFDPKSEQDKHEPWSDQMLNIFGAELADRTRWSEDIAFCRRWAAIGGKVWLDPYILLQHWGMHCFTGYAAPMFQPADPPAPRVINMEGPRHERIADRLRPRPPQAAAGGGPRILARPGHAGHEPRRRRGCAVGSGRPAAALRG